MRFKEFQDGDEAIDIGTQPMLRERNKDWSVPFQSQSKSEQSTGSRGL